MPTAFSASPGLLISTNAKQLGLPVLGTVITSTDATSPAFANSALTSSSVVARAKLPTNNFVFIADGTTLTVYANGKRLTGLTIGQLAAGRFAVIAWQESGETTCLYENYWIWKLGE